MTITWLIIFVNENSVKYFLHNTMCKDEWIIDGNYDSTMELRFQAWDIVIFLDYPLETCLSAPEVCYGELYHK